MASRQASRHGRSDPADNAPTKYWALPIIRMIEAKELKTKGQRRGTRYFTK